MDNKILVTLDNEFSENILLRTIELKEAKISSLIYDPDPKCKYIIAGTNLGSTMFYESETGKLIKSYTDKLIEDVTSLNLICTYF